MLYSAYKLPPNLNYLVLYIPIKYKQYKYLIKVK